MLTLNLVSWVIFRRVIVIEPAPDRTVGSHSSKPAFRGCRISLLWISSPVYLHEKVEGVALERRERTLMNGIGPKQTRAELIETTK